MLAESSAIKMLSLVLGLGNIGEQYKSSRHNLGFKVIELLLRTYKLKLKPATSEYNWTVKESGAAKIFLAMPKTYMNNSGIAAASLMRRLKITPSQMLVVVDDFNLSLGRIRFRKSGSDGGHNGLASLIQSLETENFPRLRLGIGAPPENTDSVDYVLNPFKKEEIEPVEKMINIASEAVSYSLEYGLEEAMTKYNRNPV